MARIIALFGPQQVGKSTAALSLVQRHDFVRVAFADPLYRMVAGLMELGVEDVRKLPKNEPIKALGGQTLRHALQTLGTEWGRDLMNYDIWVDTAVRKILELTEANHSVIVDDLRFYNEYEALEAIDCEFVRLQRPDMPAQVNRSHASEVAWHYFKSHADVTNPPDGAEDWAQKAGDAVLDALPTATG